MERESFSSRLGFILISAGCAIGLGNVWRFPFVTGQYGGASFVLIYLCFLLLLGLPIMVAEFAVGRASRRSPAKSFDTLEPKGTKWHLFKYVTIAGNIILMMFYTTVSGWMLYFLYKMAVGDLSGLDAQGIKGVFGALLQDPATMAGNMAIIIMLCFGVCYMGVRNGVERITKVMMAFLIVLMVVLAANSMLLPGSEAGLKYYLYPDFDKIAEHGVREVIFAAMGQAFFTLSIGMGSLSIFGSYIGKEQKLTNEALWIMFLDTFVAIVAGLIIFPACFSFGIQPDAGPNLLFITLPNVFKEAFATMPLVGTAIAVLFYVLLSLAALTSLISLHEVSTAFFHEEFNISRKKAATCVTASLCVLGAFCSLSVGNRDWFIIGGRSLFDLFDFVTGQIMLPVAGFLTCLFLGWVVPTKVVKDEFTNEGTLRSTLFGVYLLLIRYVCPVCIVAIFLNQLGLI